MKKIKVKGKGVIFFSNSISSIPISQSAYKETVLMTNAIIIYIFKVILSFKQYSTRNLVSKCKFIFALYILPSAVYRLCTYYLQYKQYIGDLFHMHIIIGKNNIMVADITVIV